MPILLRSLLRSISLVQSYATHPQGTKHIFHPKALHLGHVARSFALNAPPNAFRKRGADQQQQHPQAPQQRGGVHPRQQQPATSGGAFPTNRNKNKSGKTLTNPYAKALQSEFSTGF